jgi:hypothetical protein
MREYVEEKNDTKGLWGLCACSVEVNRNAGQLEVQLLLVQPQMVKNIRSPEVVSAPHRQPYYNIQISLLDAALETTVKTREAGWLETIGGGQQGSKREEGIMQSFTARVCMALLILQFARMLHAWYLADHHPPLPTITHHYPPSPTITHHIPHHVTIYWSKAAGERREMLVVSWNDGAIKLNWVVRQGLSAAF